MSKIFISHSSTNNAQALAIRKWLKASGWDECFLDISVDEGLSAGRWQEALKQAGDRCKVVLCLLSPKWVNSRECLLEYKLGERSGKAIVGIIIESMPVEALPEDFRANWQCFDLVNDVDQKEIVVEDDQGRKTKVGFGVAGLKRLEHGLRNAGLDPGYVLWPPANDPLRAPYPGLRAFEEDDAGVFFGRGRELGLVEKTLVSLRERNEPQMLVIQGASGAGKSSFLSAGLWPRLRRNYDRNFYLLPVIRPQSAAITGPTGGITAFETALREVGKVQTRASIQKSLKKGREGAATLIDQVRHGAHKKLCDPGTPLPTVVFSIDQWEQLYRDSEDTESADFLDLIQQVLQLCGAESSGDQSSLPALMLLAVRSDAHDDLEKDERFLGIRKEWFEMPSLRREDYKAVIEGPAGRSTASGRELTIDPALTDQLLQDVAGTDALPLLAYTLNQLWDQHGKDGNLTSEEYLEWGGFGTSIRAALNRARKDPGSFPAIPFDRGERDILLQDTFIPWFVSIDQETGEVKGRQVKDADLPDSIRPMVERLIQARLLVRGRQFLDEYQKEVVVAKLATDIVIHKWRAPGEWSQTDRDALRITDEVRKAAKGWVAHGREKDWLVHAGSRLHDAQEVRVRPMFGMFLGDLGAEYLNSCAGKVSPAKETQTKGEAQWLKWVVERIAKSFRPVWHMVSAMAGFIFSLRFILWFMFIGGILNAIVGKHEPEPDTPSVVPQVSSRLDDDSVQSGAQGGRAIPEQSQGPTPEPVQSLSASPKSSSESGKEEKGNEMAVKVNGALATITVLNKSCGPIDYYVNGVQKVYALPSGEEKSFQIQPGEFEAKSCGAGIDCSDMVRLTLQPEGLNYLFGSESGCWLPRPLVQGIWMQVQGKERARIEERFKKEAQEKYRALGYGFARLRKLPLSFYRDAELIEAEILTPNRGSAVVAFVVGEKGVTVIGDGDKGLIYSLNDQYSINLSDAGKVGDYVQYYVPSFHKGDMVVQDSKDIPWRPDADAERKGDVGNKLRSIKVKNNRDGTWRVSAIVHSGDALVSVDWLINLKGEVDLVEDSADELIADIPAKKTVYANSLRYEE